MKPLRVVALDPCVTDVVRALGCGSWLVGRSHACDPRESAPAVPAVTRPALEESVGPAVARVDVEAVAALQPDVVLASGPCRTLAELWPEMRRIADALQVPERGVLLVTRLEGRLRAVAERAGALGTRPRVAFLERADSPVAAGDWTPELVALAGGEDLFGAAGSPARPIAWSELSAADPDVLWLAPSGAGLGEARTAAAALGDREAWCELRAVREGRAFVGDGRTLFHRAGPRVSTSLEALAEAIHPGAFRFGHQGSGWARAPAPASPAAPRGRGAFSASA